MAVTGNLAPTFVFAMKAIPDLDSDTDSIQMGGSVDGEFHGADATTTNIKPLRIYDIGDGHFVQGVSLRTSDGEAQGTATAPMVVEILSSELPRSAATNEAVQEVTVAVNKLNSAGKEVSDCVVLDSTNETEILGAVSEYFLDLSLIVLSNTSASDVRVDIYDGPVADGFLKFSISLIADSGGAVVPLHTKMEQSAAGRPWVAVCSAAVTDVRVTLQAVKRPE